jgi:DNA modification methylase
LSERLYLGNEVSKNMNAWYKIFQKDCLEWLSEPKDSSIHLTFVDPPFNQGKDYKYFNDTQPPEQYWNWLEEILSQIYKATAQGGAVYFMQREKNTEEVLRILRKARWTFQNLIIWRKKTSAVPCDFRFSKQYQIIAFSTKGEKPRVFNKLRIDLPNPPEYRYERENGIYVTDVWEDIRELTSGYFAGDEAMRDTKGNRIHTQQSPVSLLLRTILASTIPGDTVLDPFAGTGTTLVVAHQLQRNAIGVEIDPEHVKIIENRLDCLRGADDVSQYSKYYRYTPDLERIWPGEKTINAKQWRLL